MAEGKIGKWLESVRIRVRASGNAALCDQMQRTLEQSVNLHQQLEGGYHTHHTEESDTHGWAVADGATLVGSGASVLAEPNTSISAEDVAKQEAARDSVRQTGVIAAVMVHPFAGGSEHDDGGIPTSVGENGEPHDSMRFETKLQALLVVSAHQNFPWYFRKHKPSARR